LSLIFKLVISGGGIGVWFWGISVWFVVVKNKYLSPFLSPHSDCTLLATILSLGVTKLIQYNHWQSKVKIYPKNQTFLANVNFKVTTFLIPNSQSVLWPPSVRGLFYFNQQENSAMKSESAYSISWELVTSAIRRRKYLGDKALEEMTDDDFSSLKTEIESVMDHHIDDLLEMSFEAYELINGL